MRNKMKNTLRKPANLIKMGVIALGLFSAFHTATAGEYWAASAPITYKLATPGAMTPFQPAAPVQSFDQSRISKAMAPHQSLGNPYTVYGKTYTPKHQPNYDMVGTASWYGDKFHGKPTASGEAYNKNDYTAAHKTLPLNSLVVVTNLQTGQSVTLRINDRGPFVGERVIDLSEAAARALGLQSTGLGDVRVQYAGPSEAGIASDSAPLTAAAPEFSAPSARPLAPQIAPQPVQQPLAPYQPLRDMGQTAQLNPHSISPIMIAPHMSLPPAPVAIPEAYAAPIGGDDQSVTLTIKGQIHMADTEGEARFIQAVNKK